MIKEELEEPFLYLPPRTNLNKIDYDFQLKTKSSTTSPQMSWLILTDDWLFVVACHVMPFDSLKEEFFLFLLSTYIFLAMVFHLSIVCNWTLRLHRSDCRIYTEYMKIQIQILKIQTVSIEIVEYSHTRLLIASLTMFSVIWLSHAVPE